MGGSKPLKQNAIDGKKSMEPFSPAVENAKQAGMYSLLHKPLSGKNAKKQMAAAMKDKNNGYEFFTIGMLWQLLGWLCCYSLAARREQ